jgi:hypothetical protein
MSYDISYRRQAFVMKAAQAGNYDDICFLIEGAGSNNVVELHSRRRARSWFCLATGSNWECLAEVTRCASSCCGGSLILYGRRNTEPETYIRAWRNALKTALPFEEAHHRGFSLHLFTRLTQEEATNGRKYAFDLLSKQTLVTVGQHTDPFNGKIAMEWRFNAAVPEQVKLWTETRASGRGFKSVDADGPHR